MTGKMKILGIHDGHNSSAAVYIDGEIVAAIQEERLRYKKNWTGYPENAVQCVIEMAGVSAEDIDAIVFNGHHMPKDMSKDQLIEAHKIRWGVKTRLKGVIKKTVLGKLYTNSRKQERIANVIESGFSSDKVTFIDHHHCHASAAYHGWGKYDEPILVLTCDGSGDRICASVNIGYEGVLKRLADVPESESLGSLYACITTVMGFVPLEHEYKLMGMAPYSEFKYAEEVADIFRRHFELDRKAGLTWRRSLNCPPLYYSYWYWRDKLEGRRFDSIMGGLQIFVEELFLAG